MAIDTLPRPKLTTTDGRPRPLRWVGYSWDPSRVVRFEDARGELCEAPAGAALRFGLFELATSTPERRDALRAWAADPTIEFAVLAARPNEQGALS